MGALLALACCKDTSSNLQRGDELFAEGRWTEAVEAYERVLAEYPHSYDAAWGIARIYCEKAHHPDKCLRWTERLLEGYPDDPRYKRARAQGLRDRAAAHRARGDEEAAKADEAAATLLDPR